MTRHSVSEAELVQIAARALRIAQRIGLLADALDTRANSRYADTATDIEMSAIELSDQLDILCDFIRTTLPIDEATI